jgi:hypothetical protein
LKLNGPSSGQGREVNVNLFTITASIISLVAGIAIGENFPRPGPGQGEQAGEPAGHAYWCGKIAGEVWAQGEIFGTTRVSDSTSELQECDEAQRLAQDYDKAQGTRVVVAAQQQTSHDLTARLLTAFGPKRWH